MATWTFLDLGSFVDKMTPVFEKLSVYYELSSKKAFFETLDKSESRVYFLDGLIALEELNNMLDQMSPRSVCYLVVDSQTMSDTQEGEINRFLISSNRVKGVIEQNQGMGFLISQFNGVKEISDLLFEVDTDQEYIDDFDKELDKVTKHLSLQLERIKKIHKDMVPKRIIEAGRIGIQCKYGAGESSHSEFWDVFVHKDQVTTVLLSTASSTSLTTVLEEVLSFMGKKNRERRDLKAFYQAINEKIEEPYSLFVMLTDINDLQSYIINIGYSHLYMNGKEVEAAEDGKISKLKFNPGDKFYICSHGMALNFEDEFRMDELETMLKRKWSLDGAEFIDELFMSSKMNKEGRFQKNDTTFMIFEVNNDKV